MLKRVHDAVASGKVAGRLPAFSVFKASKTLLRAKNFAFFKSFLQKNFKTFIKKSRGPRATCAIRARPLKLYRNKTQKNTNHSTEQRDLISMLVLKKMLRITRIVRIKFATSGPAIDTIDQCAVLYDRTTFFSRKKRKKKVNDHTEFYTEFHTEFYIKFHTDDRTEFSTDRLHQKSTEIEHRKTRLQGGISITGAKKHDLKIRAKTPRSNEPKTTPKTDVKISTKKRTRNHNKKKKKFRFFLMRISFCFSTIPKFQYDRP